MNTVKRLIYCTTLVAVLGVSGCILPGDARYDERRDHHRDHHRGSRHDDDRRSYADCNRHDRDCPEPVLYTL